MAGARILQFKAPSPAPGRDETRKKELLLTAALEVLTNKKLADATLEEIAGLAELDILDTLAMVGDKAAGGRRGWGHDPHEFRATALAIPLRHGFATS